MTTESTPPPNLTYHSHAIPNPREWWWDLLAEFFATHKCQEIALPDRQSIVANQTRRGVSTNQLSLRHPRFQQAFGGLDRFSPSIGMLAGIAATTTGCIPDAAAINLYRDGSDYVGHHHDPEILLGAGPG